MPTFKDKSFSAFLFDMDGTLLSSLPAVERAWRTWANRHGIDADLLLTTLHGVRAEDTIRRFFSDEAAVQQEAKWILDFECEDTDGVTAIPGIHALLDQLAPTEWAIVTSAPKALALTRLKAAGIPVPPHLYTAEDVSKGKPHPEGFMKAAEQLGVAIEDCLVFEDSPAGVAAARAAGASVVIIGGHVEANDQDFEIQDYL